MIVVAATLAVVYWYYRSSKKIDKYTIEDHHVPLTKTFKSKLHDIYVKQKSIPDSDKIDGTNALIRMSAYGDMPPMMYN